MTKKRSDNRFEQRHRYLTNKVTRLLQQTRKKQDFHLADLREGKRADEHLKRGQMITSELYRLEDGDSEFSVIDYEDPEQKEVTVRIDPNRTPQQNAQQAFRLYRKAKVKFEQATRLLSHDEQQIAWLLSLERALMTAESIEDLDALADEIKLAERNERRSSDDQSDYADQQNRLNPGKPGKRRKHKPTMKNRPTKQRNDSSTLSTADYTSSDGFTILVGRNNLQNDRLALKTARRDDLWFHVKDAPGTHVLLQRQGKDVSDKTLIEAATLAAWFSRPNKQQENYKLPIDYCEARYVRKPKGAKPGMVIYDHHRTLIIDVQSPEKLGISENI